MQAIVLHGESEPRDVRPEAAPDPSPGPGEVVVRLRAAALNHRDVYICRGRYAGLRFPVIPGSDGVGEVAALGPDVSSVREGERVVLYPSLDWGEEERLPGPRFRILGMPDDGTFAQLVKTPAANIFPAPPNLNDAEAAALPLAGLTAYRALVTRGRLRAGETVLVTGIGGGVATFVLLFARQLGARVLVTSGSAEKLQRARELGAAAVFDYHTEWAKAARAASGGRGPDLVVDGTGGATFEQALDAAAPGGRVVSYGATTGDAPHLTVRRIFWKQLDICGTTMGSPADFRGMLALIQQGQLRPVVDQVFPLGEAGAALERMERAAQLGKIVLRIP